MTCRTKLLSLLAITLIHAGANRVTAAELPAASSAPVIFSRDIQPIFEASCIKCHARGRDKGGFRLDTRETILKGGDSGPAAVPGRSAESLLVELVAGLDPDNVMPQKGTHLTAEQVGVVRAWIDQGLPWGEGVTFARKAASNLVPRRPTLPSATADAVSHHPVDLLIAAGSGNPAPDSSAVVADQTFARRVFFDLIGLPPTPQELETFLTSTASDKRERLVDQLLSDNRRYAEHWLTFWNDLLRNDYRGTGYIDGGRKQITRWLYSALATNMPYDRFVATLINPNEESQGFTKGIVWRGVVNASQTPPMQAAQNISQVFMGINLKCASCHDSFIDDWTLADSYGLASVYAEEPLEMVRCDKPTGKFATLKFLYPELGLISADKPRAERLEELANLITQPKNGRLSRTIVNRLWAIFLGRGLVEPIDNMEAAAWNVDVLDWLAEDLVEHGYNLKHTMRRILTSQAYQLPTAPAEASSSVTYQFRGPEVRRLSAEQFRDALGSVTGVGFDLPAATVDFRAGESQAEAPSQNLQQVVRPEWIWDQAGAAEKAEPGTLYLRKRINLPKAPTTASLVVTCDNRFKLHINGTEVTSGDNFASPRLLDIQSHLHSGENIIAVAATNDRVKDSDPTSNPAGFFLYARVRHEDSIPAQTKGLFGLNSPADPSDPLGAQIPVETIMDFASDESWICSSRKSDDWTTVNFLPDGWQHAVALGDLEMAPWNLGEELGSRMATLQYTGKGRASLVNADPLTIALGRPNREQLMTRRSSIATTIQALELTNGKTLAELLTQGAANLIEQSGPSSRGLIERLYLRALSRSPNARELALAEELIGQPARPDGVEDLIWAVAMLPEFQLIY